MLLFKNTAGNGFLTCNDSVLPFVNPDLLAIIEWGGASVNPDDSVLTVEQVSPISIAANETLGICIILTDDPDNAAPISGRSSAHQPARRHPLSQANPRAPSPLLLPSQNAPAEPRNPNGRHPEVGILSIRVSATDSKPARYGSPVWPVDG